MFWDWTKDAIDTTASAPVQLQQEPDLLAAALEAKGVSSDKPVVVNKNLSERCYATSRQHSSVQTSRSEPRPVQDRCSECLVELLRNYV